MNGLWGSSVQEFVIERFWSALWSRRYWRLKALGFVALILALTIFGLWRYFFADMPRIPDRQTLWSANRESGMAFLDGSGELLSVRGALYAKAADLTRMPEALPQAFIAAEDRRFYAHDGVDQRAILRALSANIQARHTVQGGSTITQQLVKNLILTPERSLKRKVQEFYLARALERELSKSEILTLYLNRIFLGAGAYGVPAAAELYFHKRVEDLTLGECALLAALPKAPSRFAPHQNYAEAKIRQRVVLANMVEAGFVTAQEAQAADAQELTIFGRKSYPENGAGYSIDYAQAQIRKLLPNAPGDLVVRLTIQPDLQRVAENVVTESLARDGKALRVHQAAFVAMDRFGAVRAMVGGVDYRASKFNRAVQAKRQPGSTFKPFVYAAALEAGLTPRSVRLDGPISIRGWKPRNYGGGYAGPTTLQYAVAQSLNTVVVRLANEVGLDRVVEITHRLGVSSPIQSNLSIALGASEVNLMELTSAYAPFANEGYRTEPFVIDEVRDSRGNLLYRHKASTPEQVISPDVAHQMTFMLKSVIDHGTGTKAALADRDVAGKTGTSQDWRDAWFVGYTADWIGGVWVGNDNHSPMAHVTGGSLPSIIWRKFMEEAHQGLSAHSLTVDDGVRVSPYVSGRVALYQDIAQSLNPPATNVEVVMANAAAEELTGIY